MIENFKLKAHEIFDRIKYNSVFHLVGCPLRGAACVAASAVDYVDRGLSIPLCGHICLFIK